MHNSVTVKICRICFKFPTFWCVVININKAKSSGIARDFPDESSSDSDTLIEPDTETINETDSSYSETDCDEDVQINLDNLDISNTDNSTEKKWWLDSSFGSWCRSR